MVASCSAIVADRLEGVLPPLGRREFAALAASVRAHGVLSAVVVSAGPYAPGVVVDGRQRLAACEQLGVDCPREQRTFTSEAELRVFQLEANLTRRQLTQAQRIRLGLLIEPWQRRLALERRAQAKGKPRGVKTVPVSRPEQSGETREQVAKRIGLSAATYTRGAKVLREGSPQLVAAFERGDESANSAYRRLLAEQRLTNVHQLAQEIAHRPPRLPRGRYQVLVIDPPWPYQQAHTLPYPTMPLSEITALPVRTLTTDDAVIWLWTTNHFLRQAHELAQDHWELTVRNVLTWAKDRQGTGSWLRGQTEHCLLCTHGHPHLQAKNESTLLHGKARQHSRKPETFYALVERTCPGSKLELFARQPRPGWAS